MRVLFYRDCRAINKLQFAEVSAAGTSITDPKAAVVLDTEWHQKKWSTQVATTKIKMVHCFHDWNVLFPSYKC